MTIFQVRKNFVAQSDKFYTSNAILNLQEFAECDCLLIGCSAEFGGDYYLTKEVDTINDAMAFINSNEGIYWALECYTEDSELPATTFDVAKINVNE